MKKGDTVIISYNPHQAGYEKILGTVVMVRKNAGSGGVDLIDVTYPGIRNNLPSLPFAPYNLEETSAERLVELAEHHYELASYYRRLAEEAKRRNGEAR
jgi:hypothetical protein